MKTLNEKLEEAREHLRYLRKQARAKQIMQGTIGGVVRQHRERLNLTIKEFSIISGVGLGMLHQLELQPDANPTVKNLSLIATGLGMSLSELLAEVEEQRNSHIKNQQSTYNPNQKWTNSATPQMQQADEEDDLVGAGA
jgi:transcriptional regulator with XRE-family HTH domain